MNKVIKYGLVLVVLLVTFMSVKSCINNQQKILQGENSQLLKQVEQLKEKTVIVEEERVKQRDSLNQQISKKEGSIKSLSVQVAQSRSRLKNLQKENEQNKVRVRQLESYKLLADEYNEIYETKSAVATDKGVELQKDLPYLVLEGLFDAMHCQEVVEEKDKQLSLTNTQLEYRESQLDYKDLIIADSEYSLQAHKALIEAQENLTNGLQRENKKLKKGRWFEKWVIRPLIFGGGIFLGSQL